MNLKSKKRRNSSHLLQLWEEIRSKGLTWAEHMKDGQKKIHGHNLPAEDMVLPHSLSLCHWLWGVLCVVSVWMSLSSVKAQGPHGILYCKLCQKRREVFMLKTEVSTAFKPAARSSSKKTDGWRSQSSLKNSTVANERHEMMVIINADTINPCAIFFFFFF